MVVLIMSMVMFIMGMLMPMIMQAVIGVEMLGIVGVVAYGVRRFDVFSCVFLSVLFGMLLALMRLGCLRSIGACVLDDVALDALAIASAA